MKRSIPASRRVQRRSAKLRQQHSQQKLQNQARIAHSLKNQDENATEPTVSL